MPHQNTSFKQRLTLDEGRGEYLDGDVRYVMLRADVLMGLFSELAPASRTAALAAFQNSVAKSGGKSVARYYAATGEDAAGLLEVLEATSSQLGWGAWAFETTPQALTLQVTNSPFAMSMPRSAEPVCHAILGILENAAPLVLNGAVRLQETRCAARDGGDRCTFHASRETAPCEA